MKESPFSTEQKTNQASNFRNQTAHQTNIFTRAKASELPERNRSEAPAEELTGAEPETCCPVFFPDERRIISLRPHGNRSSLLSLEETCEKIFESCENQKKRVCVAGSGLKKAARAPVEQVGYLGGGAVMDFNGQ
ncbi:hypothetical protein KFK09_022984 [Dendrobium nobile]|uniref:Uncharacterized protein n=1 Tax=Dendrobium nobile TaxID=94219 RepID=A0A8T3ALF7_DENNO|nr:hypothetical protein KFK09_022984 [Dendrobium nobile]